MKLRLDVELTDVEAAKLDRNLRRLKTELARLGETF